MTEECAAARAQTGRETLIWSQGIGDGSAGDAAPDAGGERKVVPLLASLFGGGQKSSSQQQQQKAGTKVTEGGTKTLKKGNIFDAFKRAA